MNGYRMYVGSDLAAHQALRELLRANHPTARRHALVRLGQEVGVLGESADASEAEVVEDRLKVAVQGLRDALYRDVAHLLLLNPDHSSSNLTSRRHRASYMLGMSADNFRRRHERLILDEVIYQLRLNRVDAVAGLPESSSLKETDESSGPYSLTVLNQLLGDVDEAVVLLGGVLLVKMGGRTIGRELTTPELRAIRGHRADALREGASALAFLLQPEEPELPPADTSAG